MATFRNSPFRAILVATSLFASLGLMTSTSGGATRTSVASGNWTTPSVWGGTVPANGDNIVISSGTTVTVNTNTASINDIVIQTNAALVGDGTGKILLYGNGGGEDLTNTGTLDFSGVRRARLKLSKASQWGGSGGTWLLDTLDLNFKTLSVTAGATFTVQFSGTGTCIVNPGFLNGMATTTFEFVGPAAQSLPATTAVKYGSIIANSPGGLSLRVALSATTLLGDLRVVQGTLGNGGFAIAGNATKQFEVRSGARFLLTSTTGMVTGFGSRIFSPTSTVEYGGASQTISTESYGHLRLSGTGTKTLPPGALSIGGDLSIAGSASAIAAAGLTVNGSVTIESGAGLGLGTYSHAVRGNWSNAGTLGAGTSTVTFNGSVHQSVAGSSFSRLVIDNPAGILLLSDMTVASQLSFIRGNLATQTYRAIIAPGGSVARTSGHVVGVLEKTVSPSTPSQRFEIGDPVRYSPMDLSFTGVTVPGSVNAQTLTGDHPAIGSSGLDADRSANRYYRIATGTTPFSTYDATVAVDPLELDPGAGMDSLESSLYASGSWTPLTAGSRTASTIQSLGLTTPGDIAVAELKRYTITATSSAGGAVDPAGVIVVRHGSSRTISILPALGYHTDSVVVDGVNQGAVGSYAFSNVTANHTIAAYFSIDRFAITASATAGGSISPSGSVSVDYGAGQTFTLTPATGHHIDSVLVDGVNQGAVSSYAFSNVTANHTIAAYFSIDRFTITASASAGGSISPAGTVTVNYGAGQTFTVTPATGHHIDSVLVDGVNQGPVGSYAFSNVTSNHTIAAYFSIDRFTITASASAGGSISPSGSVGVDHGAGQTFTVTPATGHHIDSVLVDGVNQGAASSYAFSNVTANHTIAAYFSIDRFTITASATAGGSISPSGSVSIDYGAGQTFTVTPATGHHIDSVLVDGVNQGAVSSYAFSNVTANHTIAAYFSIDRFTITATHSGNGSIIPSGTVTVPYGGSQLFTITPASGHHVDSVLVDGANMGNISSYLFSAVRAPHTIAAFFSPDRFFITASASAGGSIAPSGAVPVLYGGSQTFTIEASPNHHIDSVVVDGVNRGVLASYTFSAVTAAHAIAAYFSIDRYIITASAGSGGTIAPSGAVPVNAGSSQSFTMTPATGYHLDSVLVDGVSQGAPASYTFSNVTANHAIAAFYSINRYVLTAAAGAGGTITPSGPVSVPYGADQQFTMTAATGHHLDSVVVDGINRGTPGTYTFTAVSANHTISAYYSADRFTITAVAGPHGTISPSGTDTVTYGESRTYTMTPETGHEIQDVMVDGTSRGPLASYAFTEVSASHVIAVSFRIRQVTVVLAPRRGWNILSVPVLVPDYRRAILFPSAITGAVGFQGAYHLRDTLANGEGYWLKFGAADSLPMTGGMRPSDTVEVDMGWNLVGTLSMDIPASSVVALGTQLQTGFYGFNGSYSLGTVLQAGRGYWVKVSSAGRLLMQSAGVASGAAEPAALPPENLQTLTFLDAEGSVQTLYYGAASPGDSLDGRYELPPVPPEGVYDVRFTGSGLVHTAMTSDGRLRERAIAATGLRYPVRVRWSGTHDLRLQCVLEYAGGGRTHRIVLSAGEHEAVIPGPAASGFVLKPAVPDVPLTFALGQNFPNPFNPVTQVEFSVARAGRVRLSVFDQLGREVGVIVDEDLAPGFYRRTIDGGSLASGVYYYRLRAEGFSATRRMVLLR